VEAGPGQTVNIAAVLDHCRQQLASYKVPERLVIVERLPRNQMGKVPRAQLLRLVADSEDSTGEV
jgi:acyl-coenzyme A synthetase/AMP-(fatty) acid ligase